MVLLDSSFEIWRRSGLPGLGKRASTMEHVGSYLSTERDKYEFDLRYICASG